MHMCSKLGFVAVQHKLAVNLKSFIGITNFQACHPSGSARCDNFFVSFKFEEKGEGMQE